MNKWGLGLKNSCVLICLCEDRALGTLVARRQEEERVKEETRTECFAPAALQASKESTARVVLWRELGLARATRDPKMF